MPIYGRAQTMIGVIVIIELIVMQLVAPKAVAKHKLMFNKSTPEASL
jgi:hypothetical protein